MLIDYHLHIERGPYTLEWVEEFIRQGKAQGISEFGFSEHGYRFVQAGHLLNNPWTNQRCTADIEEYIALINAAKLQGFPVKLGLELDYIPEKEQEIRDFINSYPFDFVIGSVHWLGDWGFDLEETLPRWEKADISQVYKRYFNLVQQAAKSRIFDFLGHMDLIKIFGFRPDANIFPLLRQTVEVIAQSGCTIEVSTAGLRKRVEEIYPHPDILKLCRDKGVPITLSSDAHSPHEVGENFTLAVEMLNSLGFTELTTFELRKEQSVALNR